ncbi:MAG: ribulose-phosphate 3-epimerase [Candidatus Hermodarchaeota archaeon]
MKKIAVSIHAIENFTVDILKGLEGYDYIHIDFMDGLFVNNECKNLDVFKEVKETYDIPIIAHLMVINPFDYIKEIINFVDIFLFHFEINNNLPDIIEEVRRYNKKVGIAFNPNTDVNEIIPYLNEIDLILVMSVHPGWSGQKFLKSSLEKVNKLAHYKKEYNFFIDIDGGINLTNAKLLKNTDILTSSSTILKAKDPNKIINLLKFSDENE